MTVETTVGPGFATAPHAARRELEAMFAPGGPLASVFAPLRSGQASALDAGAFEERAGQREMALAVFDSLTLGHPLLVEAGTGTGKTLAYLLAAALAGKKTVISTATRALQDQIILADVPRLQRALASVGRGVTVASMKGLPNYLCRRRHEEAAGGEIDAPLERITEWLQHTQSGDVSELADFSDASPVWLRVRSSTETRLGSSCKFFDSCFVTERKRAAERADIVVVNHHLFFADLALRSRPEGAFASVIPPYDAVIFDEAHQVENVASDFFGSRVTSTRFESLATDLKRAYIREGIEGELSTPVGREGTTNEVLARVNDAARRFFDALPRSEVGERAMLTPSHITGAFKDAMSELDEALCMLHQRALEHEMRDSFRSVLRRIEMLRTELADLWAAEDQAALEEDPDRTVDRVYWVDRRERSVAVGATAVDLAGVFRERLFERVPSVVCTSATLSTGGSFHYARARLGVPADTQELIVPSPFDYATRAGLYIARDLPDPKSPAFEQEGYARMLDLVTLSEGGAFVLTTSLRAMRGIAAHLRAKTRGNLQVLVQGESSKTVLLERFRTEPRTVLVATMTFWEGVDVPGDALRLVIVEKLPFPVPSDPLVMARSARLDRAGGNSFVEYMVPQASITLKQGFGRLIRGKSDRGVVALLDSRAAAKGYGKRLLTSLPPARRLETLDDVRAFWREIMLADR